MKTPFVTLDQLKAITAQYPTPFHIYDEKGIRENARRLKAAFAWNPGYREYFAVKATPTPAILKLLKEEGCGADCSSLTELMMADRCGIRGRTSCSPPTTRRRRSSAWPPSWAPSSTWTTSPTSTFSTAFWAICRRRSAAAYNPGGMFTLGDTREGFQVMDTPGDAKYGMTREQLFEAFRQLKALGVKEFGLHSFLASNTLSNDYYPALARILFHLAVELQKETGCHISFINLSGGIGIPYQPDQTANDIAVIGEGVRQVYEEVLTANGMGDVALYTELGRFMLGPYGHLVTTVLHEKHTYKDYIGRGRLRLQPDAAGHVRRLSPHHRHGQGGAPCDHKYDVAGSLCENNDKFAVDRMLPKVDIGDLLVIHDTGAHGFSMGYNYNGKLRSAELLLREDGSVQLIRRAETPEDYFATLLWD